MKKKSKLVALMPGQSLENFPSHGDEADAKSLLSAWTGLWHPVLINNARRIPVWHCADDTASSEEEAADRRDRFVQNHYYDDSDSEWADGSGEAPADFDQGGFTSQWSDALVTLPKPSANLIGKGFVSAAEKLNATVVDLTDARTRADWLDSISIISEVSDSIVEDFFSLGYAQLQVELMTRKLRFSSDLEPSRFDPLVIDAAAAAVAGDDALAAEKITAAFDLLAEEKNKYYPVAADLIDVVLIADSTKPAAIERELDSVRPVSFLITGSKLNQLQRDSPETLQRLTKAVDAKTACLIGGLEHELPDNLLASDSILNQLLLGRKSFTAVTGQPASVFMRRRYGLTGLLPGMLSSLGFVGAMHVSLDQGKFPRSGSCSIRWSGVDGASVMAASNIPLNAAAEKSFLELGVKIGSELDSEHVSTIFLARWPGQTCDSFQDVRNAEKYGKVLGSFSDADTHFHQVYDPGYSESFDVDDYESPWFAQAIASGSSASVSAVVDYWKRWYSLAACRSLIAMLAIGEHNSRSVSEALNAIDSLQQKVELEMLEWGSEERESAEQLDREIEETLQRLAEHFGGSDLTAVNTAAWRRRTAISTATPKQGSSKGKGCVKFAAAEKGAASLVLEQSGFGVQSIDLSEQFAIHELAQEPFVDEGDSLRNELFEVRVDRASGGIKGLFFHGKRGNLLSQQLVFRTIDAATGEVNYSRSVCNDLQVKRISRIASEITTSGSLIGKNEKAVATFLQTMRVHRGRPIVDVEVELNPLIQLGDSSGNYFASKLAWADESAELFSDVLGARHSVRRPTIESPHFVEVVQAAGKFAMLSHGIPWHRRSSKRMLDSILVAGKERQTKFQFGIGVNLDSVMQTAVAEMHPRIIVEGSSQQNANTKKADTKELPLPKWLLHIANRNVVASWWEPVLDTDRRCTGIRVRLQEVEGTAGRLQLYCRRHVVAVERESFIGDFEREFPIDDEARKHDGVSVVGADFSAWEYFQLHIKWT